MIRALGSLKAIGAREAVLIHCFNIRDAGSLANRLMELAKPSFDRRIKLLDGLGFTVRGKMALGLPQIEINRCKAFCDQDALSFPDKEVTKRFVAERMRTAAQQRKEPAG